MNSDNISSRFLKSLTSDDLLSQDGTRSEGSWNGEDKIIRTYTSPLLSDIVRWRRSLIKSSLIMSAGRDSIVSIVASDDMFPISWIIPGLRAGEHYLGLTSWVSEAPLRSGVGVGEPLLKTGALNIAAAEALSGNCHICEVQHCEAESSDWLELTGTKDSKEAWREVIRNKVKHSKIGNIVEKRNWQCSS